MAAQPGQHEDNHLRNLDLLLDGKPTQNDDWQKFCAVNPDSGTNVGASPNQYMLGVACSLWVQLVLKKNPLLPGTLSKLRLVMGTKNDHNQQEGLPDDGHQHLWLVGAILTREALARLSKTGMDTSDLTYWLRLRIRQAIAQQMFRSNDLAHPETHVIVPAGQRWRAPKTVRWWPEYYILKGLSRPTNWAGFASKPAAYQGNFTVERMWSRCPASLQAFLQDVTAVYASWQSGGWDGLATHITEGTRAELTVARYSMGGYFDVQAQPRNIAPTRFISLCPKAQAKPLEANEFPDRETPVQKARTGWGRIDWTNKRLLGFDDLSELGAAYKPLRCDLPFPEGTLQYVVKTSPGGIQRLSGGALPTEDDTPAPDDPIPSDPPPTPPTGGGSHGGGIHKSAGIYDWNFGKPLPIR